jgi:hypothetical protein
MLTAVGVFLTAVGLVIAFLLGAQSSPQVRYRICSYFGFYCTRESEISIFTVEQPPRAPQRYDDVIDPIYGGAWGRLLSFAGATASDRRCFAGSSADLSASGFVLVPGQAGPQTVQKGSEFWTFKETDTIARRKDRSVIFDLRVKYSKSRVDQRILVMIKAYYQDYRISEMDTTYRITLPHETDYQTVSCGLPLPTQIGSYKYDFEIRDAEELSDVVVVHKAITIAE